jgi:hypothetical protein
MNLSNFPTASGVDLRGTYRMYAMVRGASTGVFTLQWYLAPNSTAAAAVTSDPVTFAPSNSSNRSLIDLGQITLPVGADPVNDGFSGIQKTPTGAYISFHASRTGTGNLDWDYIVLVPDDPQRGDDFVTFSLAAGGANVDVIADGPLDMVYPQTPAATTLPTWYPIPWVGRIPRLTPNQTNRFIVLRPDRAGVDINYADVKTRTTTVTISYWPLYLYARPVAT